MKRKKANDEEKWKKTFLNEAAELIERLSCGWRWLIFIL